MTQASLPVHSLSGVEGRAPSRPSVIETTPAVNALCAMPTLREGRRQAPNRSRDCGIRFGASPTSADAGASVPPVGRRRLRTPAPLQPVRLKEENSIVSPPPPFLGRKQGFRASPCAFLGCSRRSLAGWRMAGPCTARHGGTSGFTAERCGQNTQEYTRNLCWTRPRTARPYASDPR